MAGCFSSGSRIAAAGWLLSVFAMGGASRPAAAQRDGGHADLSLFTTSHECVACHNNLATASGEDVSLGTTWRSTMMANSARDPYWQASVRRETLDHPRHAAAIQDECAACHMPMSTRAARAGGAHGEVFAHLPLGGTASTLGQLAADGVSCTVCHQIAPDGLGTRASFNGGFTLDPTPPGGGRQIFGPFAVDRGRAAVMRSMTGFAQAEAGHLRDSELCASCHTLITDAFGPDGSVIGSLPEQMNYQEWQHSDFPREGRTCQSCHMPAATGPIRIASVLGAPRERLARHVFVGGNAFMVRLLNRFRTELGVEATPGEMEATARATERVLQQETAALTVIPADASGDALVFDVVVRNRTGHKFPTGYPSRRAWLHVSVRDQQGATLFESGAVDMHGAIAGNDNDVDAASFEPHYGEITRADQVQIYEPILGDSDGAPTTGLLTAVGYLKDNRLLPRGFDKATAAAEIAVHGDAARDDEFAGGADRVRYRLAGLPPGTYDIAVELRYQPIGYRWATTLERYDGDEPRAWTRYYKAMAPAATTTVAAAGTSARVTRQAP